MNSAADSEKPNITQIRVLHDLKQNFELPPEQLESLKRLLTVEDQARADRFFSGFEVEDWFEAIYAVMPWISLVHGLGQRQVPLRSKQTYQVPDFLALVESSDLKQLPLLVEVKRVNARTQSLELRRNQTANTRAYADALGIPLVYATHWDSMGVWTVNTLDSFVVKSSAFKISLEKAFEFDCGLIFGDKSYLITEPLRRVQIFSNEPFHAPACIHRDFGNLISDQITIRDFTHVLGRRDTLAADAMLDFAVTSTTQLQDRTTITSETRGAFCLKLSAWITRYLSLCQIAPNESAANTAGHAICDLMSSLGIDSWFMYPWDRTPQLKSLDERFLHPT